MIQTEVRSYPADGLTVSALYARLRARFRESLLWESESGSGFGGRYSCLAGGALSTWEVRRGYIVERSAGGIEHRERIEQPGQFRDSLQAFAGKYTFRGEAGGLPVQGIWGYIGYEAAAYRYPALFAEREREHRIPPAYYAYFQYVFIIDHQEGRIEVAGHSLPGQPAAWDWVEQWLAAGEAEPFLPRYPFRMEAPAAALVSESDFRAQAEQGLAACRRGEVWRLQLAEPWGGRAFGDVFDFYRRERQQKSRLAPGGNFFFDSGDFQLFAAAAAPHVHSDGKSLQLDWELLRRPRSEDDERDREALLPALNKLPPASVALDEETALNELSQTAAPVQWLRRRQPRVLNRHIALRSACRTATGGLSAVDWLLLLSPAVASVGCSRHAALRLLNRIESQSRDFLGGSIGFVGSDGSLRQLLLDEARLFQNRELRFFKSRRLGF